MNRYIPIIAGLIFAFSATVFAGVMTKAAKEAAEYVVNKFGKDAAEQGVETLARKIEVLAVKHGDEAFSAAKRVGPRTFQIVEEAGENGPQAIKLMARSGSDAIWVVAKKNRMAIFVKYGDDAADAMMKYGEIAEPLITSLGKPATSALNAISTQNGRRLAMMADDGSLASIGKSEELLTVVGKCGDRAMDFIWRNKGALTVAATLTAFIASPEPFLDGTVDISKSVVENVGKPLATVPGQVMAEASKNTNWTWVFSVVAAIVGCIAAFKLWLSHRKSASSN